RPRWRRRRFRGLRSGMVPAYVETTPFASRIFLPFDQVGKVVSESSRASASMRRCPGPIHCPPRSTHCPPPSFLQVRPPTRSRASRTTTLAPRRVSSRAAVRPARPAPTTTTSADRSTSAALRGRLEEEGRPRLGGAHVLGGVVGRNHLARAGARVDVG